MTDRAHWKAMLPIIQAFADGKEVEYMGVSGDWRSASTPAFWQRYAYRIKPQPIVEEWLVTPGYSSGLGSIKNIRLTFDSDTKELLSAEVIK